LPRTRHLGRGLPECEVCRPDEYREPVNQHVPEQHLRLSTALHEIAVSSNKLKTQRSESYAGLSFFIHPHLTSTTMPSTSFCLSIALLLALGSAAVNAQTVGAAAPTTEANPVLVKGATLEVRKSDLELEKKNLPPEQRLEMATNLPRVQRTLERLFLNKILLADARKAGFDKDPAVVAELEYTLNQKLASLYANQLSAKIQVPDLEPALKEQYKLEVATLVEPERVHAAHILITAKKRTKEEALRRAEEVRAKAAAGADFKQLAKEYSEDQSAQRNDGDLGFFPFEQMVPEFAKAAFAMTTPGQISPVVETDFGFHIIKYIERRAARTPPYEELRSKLLEEKDREYRAAQLRNTFNQMMENEQPKANMDEVNKLMSNPTSQAMREWNEKIRKEIQGQSQSPKRP